MTHYKHRNRFGKKWLLIIIPIAVAGFIAWRLWIYTPASKIIVKVGNTFASDESQPNSTSDTKNNKSNNPTTSDTNDTTQTNIDGPIDTKGQSKSNTPSSDWIVSASKLITVEQPIADATLTNGAILSGTAKVSSVDYTLIDNTVGVISEGTLTINNGKFSGKIMFSSSSSSGRLDVYSTNSQGVELNEVQIEVYF